MADISALTNLHSTEPLDLPLYQDRKAAKPFPPKGNYTARTPDAFPPESFGESKAGFLTVDVSPTLTGGDFDGYKIPFTRVSAKTWTNRDGVIESQLGRYLKACGINEVVNGEPQAQADLCESTANQLVTVSVDWIARYKGGMKVYEVKGMENFPTDANGQRTRFIPLDGQNGRPDVKDPISGDPLTIRAFLEVTRFSPLG